MEQAWLWLDRTLPQIIRFQLTGWKLFCAVFELAHFCVFPRVPDPYVFGLPGFASGSVSYKYGSFSHKSVEWTEIMVAK